jgi:nitrous oxidase accessory protein
VKEQIPLIWRVKTLLFMALLSPVLAPGAEVLAAESSITAAINRATNGDVVLVEGPAVYREHLALNKAVRLIGTNNPVIDGDGAGTLVIISAQNASLEGFTIRNSGRDLAASDSAIMITADHAVVQNCRIENDGFGIYLRAVQDCRIVANEISGHTNLAAAARGNGIHLWKSHDNRILANQIHDKRDGMYFSYADHNLIGGNRVRDTRFGIHYMYSHQNELVTNSLTRNAVGATLMFSRQSLVAGNVVCANRRHGMVFKQLDDSRILNNLIAGQNRGFFVQQATHNRFVGNIIATNDIGLYLSNCSEQNTFVGNAFIRNADQVWQPPFETEQGRDTPNSFCENGGGNYWSDYTGHDANQDGIGDTPYHETDVFGYILDRHPQARALALSPALALLRKGEELMPVLDTTGVTDLHPLMRPPKASP